MLVVLVPHPMAVMVGGAPSTISGGSCCGTVCLRGAPVALAVLLPVSTPGAERDDHRPNPVSLGQTHPKNIWCHPRAAQIPWRGARPLCPAPLPSHPGRGATVCPCSQQRQPRVGIFPSPLLGFTLGRLPRVCTVW